VTRGFTLLELIVVLAILALLSGMTALAWRSSRPGVAGAVLSQLAVTRAHAASEGRTTRIRFDSVTIRFFPDGSSSGGQLPVPGGTLDINPLNGQTRALR
jgi:prepilin-type N-terminal cleavage/methylation domain-containing protein